MRLLLALALASFPVLGQLTWTKTLDEGTTAPPNWNQWTRIGYDPTTDYTAMFVHDNSGGAGIYGNAAYLYRNGVLTHVGTAASGLCTASTSSWPGNRHPYNTPTIDTKRSYFWIGPGVCAGTPVTDMYYLDIAAKTWHQVTPAHLSATFSQAWVYDSTHDVIISVELVSGPSTITRVYASTIGNPTPGTLTASQMLVNGAVADDWAQVTTNTAPSGSVIPLFVWDALDNQAILFGGYNNQTPSGPQTQTWTYAPTTATWTNKSPSTSPSTPDHYSGVVGWAGAWDAVNSVVRYVRPAQTTTQTQDWSYSPTSNNWTLVGTNGASFGNGSSTIADPVSMSIDSTRGTAIVWAYQFGGFYWTWKATLPTGGSGSSFSGSFILAGGSSLH